VLVLGEVRTALLQNSVSVPPEVARQVLQLRQGEQVRSSERPIDYAASPDVLTGVDCRLATRTGKKTQGVGTIVTRASITGCRVLQGSSYTQLALAVTEPRAPWSHYLSEPGVVEVAMWKSSWDDIRDGFLGQEHPDALDLGAISERTMDGVQGRPELDRAPPFRARRTALRWTLEDSVGDALCAHFHVASPTLRMVRLAAVASTEIPALVRLCEDLALHDWLLTTLLELIERGQRMAGRPAQTVESLRPAIEHLIHLWLPGAHVDESLSSVWDGLERYPGFSRQWKASVNRVRDQIALTTASLLSAAPAAVHPQDGQDRKRSSRRRATAARSRDAGGSESRSRRRVPPGRNGKA
jgi:hypothetical protein